MADKPRLATIEIVFFLAAIFFAALNVHCHLVAPISGTPMSPFSNRVQPNGEVLALSEQSEPRS